MLWKIGFCDGSTAGRNAEDDIWITDEKDEVIIGSGGCGCCFTPAIKSTEEQTAFEIARQIVEDHNRKEVIERFKKRMENLAPDIDIEKE